MATRSGRDSVPRRLISAFSNRAVALGRGQARSQTNVKDSPTAARKRTMDASRMTRFMIKPPALCNEYIA